MSFNKSLLGFLATALAAAAGCFAALHHADSGSVPEDPDSVKHAIARDFAINPTRFDLAVASSRLADARLQGFAVCTQSEEATAAQYVEVAEFLDKARKHTAHLQRVVDEVMDSKFGMSDCDFRVISVLGKVTATD